MVKLFENFLDSDKNIETVLNFIDVSFYAINTIKLLHWFSPSGFIHETLGDLYDDLNESIDEIVEIIIYEYDNLKFVDSGKTFPDCEYSNEKVISTVLDYIDAIIQLKTNWNDQSDIISKFDDLIGMLKRYVYLLKKK